MASVLSGLLGQARAKDIDTPEHNSRDASKPRQYSGSLNRHQRSHAIENQRAQFRSMLGIEEVPSLLPIHQDESMENWAAERLVQTSQKHTTGASDWADILCYYTASNGVAPVGTHPCSCTSTKWQSTIPFARSAAKRELN